MTTSISLSGDVEFSIELPRLTKGAFVSFRQVRVQQADKPGQKAFDIGVDEHTITGVKVERDSRFAIEVTDWYRDAKYKQEDAERVCSYVLVAVARPEVGPLTQMGITVNWN